MSRSSSGFGQGLGTGLAIGYVAGSLNSRSHYGHGHSYGYRRQGGYDTQTKPMSCYEGSLTSAISGEVDLNETLTVCELTDDVCFGKITLTVTNTTTNGEIVSNGALDVSKGCGSWMVFNSSNLYTDYDAGRQCFTTDVTRTATVNTQTELCLCHGSKCNGAWARSPLILLILAAMVMGMTVRIS